jgi:NADPH-dependent 2,4-dienoyl-CoA reductase/sulfur reductase-like enzyme
LRTLDDALALRGALEKRPRVVVLGAGFIGAEVAASARTMGCEVAIVEPEPVPMLRGFGLQIGEAAAALHRREGVDLRTGIGARGIRGRGKVESVELSDGSSIDCGVVVVGIGVRPATHWLEDSGLALDDGVLCDETCAASADGVVAAGDVARWRHPRYEAPVRFEHWTNAVEQSVHAAKRLLHGPEVGPFAPVPVFWTDQFGVKMQVAGSVGRDDEIKIVDGDPSELRFVALVRNGAKLAAVVAFKRPRLFIKYSEMIGNDASWDDAVAAAAS